jgi:hypothetical protein
MYHNTIQSFPYVKLLKKRANPGPRRGFFRPSLDHPTSLLPLRNNRNIETIPGEPYKQGLTAFRLE